MRYRSNGVETVHLVARFEPGATVTMTVFDLATLGAVSLSSNVCTEIGSTGLFRWPSSSLSSQPSTYTQYVATMTDTNGVTRSQKFVLGGAMDNLDAAVGTRSSHSAADVDTTLTGSHGAGNWITATGFSTHSAGDVDTTLTTSHGAGSWQTATGFSTHSAGDVDTVLSASHGAGSWEEPTAQEMRDALKLAPSLGAPAADSVDAHLDDILADTETIEPLVSSNLDATVSGVPAAVDTTLSTSHGAGGWETATGFATSADVTSILDQTAGRRKLDTTPDPWQEVVYTEANQTIEAQRYDLYDQTGSAINSTNNPILDPAVIIAERRPV